MIRICKSIDNISEFQKGILPQNAKKLDSPTSTEDMMKKSLPICIILCVICSAVMFIKTFTAKTLCVNPIFIIIGLVIGFALLFVHEWLHAVVYPKEAEVTIGKLKGKLVFVALCSYPLKRNRFILMSLLPFVLGIIPLVWFIFSDSSLTFLNGVLFGLVCIGMVSPYPDVFNVVLVLNQTKKSDKIMFYKDDLYSIGIDS